MKIYKLLLRRFTQFYAGKFSKKLQQIFDKEMQYFGTLGALRICFIYRDLLLAPIYGLYSLSRFFMSFVIKNKNKNIL